MVPPEGVERRFSPCVTCGVEGKIDTLASNVAGMRNDLLLLTGKVDGYEEVIKEVQIVKKSLRMTWKVFAFIGTAIPSIYGIYQLWKTGSK